MKRRRLVPFGPRGVLIGLTIISAVITVVTPRQSFAAKLITIDSSGPPGAVVDLIFVAEGYRDVEKNKFFKDVESVYNQLMAAPPYATVRPLITAHALFVASQDSGSAHPSKGLAPKTAFESTFESQGLDRLITANNGLVMAAANAAFPAFDIAILVVNDGRYGGSGGAVPMISLHADSSAVLRHELAHNLANLADEYTAPYVGYPAGDSEPNVTALGNLSPLPWQVWVTSGTPIPTPLASAVSPYGPIGAYEGARYLKKQMFRPAPTCLMRTLSATFCPVCVEAIIVAVANVSTTLRAAQPTPGSTQCQQPNCPVFSVILATLTDLEVQWWLDDKLIATGSAWAMAADLVGDHVLRVEVRDKTPMVRNDPKKFLVESRQWQLEITPAKDSADGSETPNSADDIAVDKSQDGGAEMDAVATAPGQDAGEGPSQRRGGVWGSSCSAIGGYQERGRYMWLLMAIAFSLIFRARSASRAVIER